MAQNVEGYRQELPPQCVDCPMFDRGSELVRAAEDGDSLMRGHGYPQPDEPPMGFYGHYPDMRPSAPYGGNPERLRALNALGELASSAEACPGTRAGSDHSYGIRARAAAIFGGGRVCRNPLIQHVMTNYPER